MPDPRVSGSLEPGKTRREPDGLHLVALLLCGRCLNGEGGECHTPGCALWMNRAPDVPVAIVDDLKVEMTHG